jgi:hypothetical protein
MISLSDSWLPDIADASPDVRKSYYLQTNENRREADRIAAGHRAQLATMMAR